MLEKFGPVYYDNVNRETSYKILYVGGRKTNWVDSLKDKYSDSFHFIEKGNIDADDPNTYKDIDILLCLEDKPSQLSINALCAGVKVINLDTVENRLFYKSWLITFERELKSIIKDFTTIHEISRKANCHAARLLARDILEA